MDVDFSEKTAANSEESLIRSARRGETQSFSALVEAYQEKMIHVAYSFLGNWEDARDVAQEGFVKAYQSLHSFNERSRFSTWLYRIVINHCKDFLRRKRARPYEEGSDLLESLQARDRSAQHQLMDRELEAEIYRALNQLPFQQRSVFTLRYLEGLKLEEIAESLDLSTGTVKAHLWQAGQKMRQILSRLFPAEGRAG